MRQYIELIRPLNCTVAGLAAVLAYWLESSLNIRAYLIFASVFLICAAGNSINDFFDKDIDKKIKKHRPIPSGKIHPADALAYSSVLFFLGILLAYWLGPLFLATAILASVFLIAYPMALKKVKWLGNVVVSALVALPFFYGGLGAPYLSQTVIVLVMAAFFANLSREIVKDIEDIKARERGSIPKIFGVKTAALIAAFLLLLAVGICLSAVNLSYWIVLAVGIGFAFCAIFRMVSMEKDFAKKASSCIKFAMISIILAFVLGKFL